MDEFNCGRDVYYVVRFTPPEQLEGEQSDHGADSLSPSVNQMGRDFCQ